MARVKRQHAKGVIERLPTSEIASSQGPPWHRLRTLNGLDVLCATNCLVLEASHRRQRSSSGVVSAPVVVADIVAKEPARPTSPRPVELPKRQLPQIRGRGKCEQRQVADDSRFVAYVSVDGTISRESAFHLYFVKVESGFSRNGQNFSGISKHPVASSQMAPQILGDQ